jgi:hypothetical protein
MDISQSQIYYIDSSKRVSGSTSEFTYELNVNHDYDRAVVLQANIPMSYYLVRQNLNSFVVNENGTLHTITIARGNYSALSFKTILQTLLNSTCTYTYSITLPNSLSEANTAKYTYQVTNNGGHQPIFVFSDSSLVCEQMGFTIGEQYEFSANALESANVIKFVPEDTLFIHSNLICDANNDILQEIYNNNSVQFSNIVYHCNGQPDFYSKPIRENKSNIYTFKLCDENGQIINLNGLNLMITLLLYKRDTTNEFIKEYIKYRISKK